MKAWKNSWSYANLQCYQYTKNIKIQWYELPQNLHKSINKHPIICQYQRNQETHQINVQINKYKYRGNVSSKPRHGIGILRFLHGKHYKNYCKNRGYPTWSVPQEIGPQSSIFSKSLGLVPQEIGLPIVLISRPVGMMVACPGSSPWSQ